MTLFVLAAWAFRFFIGSLINLSTYETLSSFVILGLANASHDLSGITGITIDNIFDPKYSEVFGDSSKEFMKKYSDISIILWKISSSQYGVLRDGIHPSFLLRPNVRRRYESN